MSPVSDAATESSGARSGDGEDTAWSILGCLGETRSR